WVPLEVNADNVVGDDAGAEVDGLLADPLHHLRAGGGALAVVGETLVEVGEVGVAVLRKGRLAEGVEGGVVRGRPGGEVLDLRGQVELAQRQGSLVLVLVGEGPFKNERFQVGPGRVDRRRPGRRTRSDNHNFFWHVQVLRLGNAVGRIIRLNYF